MLKEEEKIKIIKLYRQGKPVTEIAEKLGIVNSTVYRQINILVNEGTLEKRPRRKRNSERKKNKNEMVIELAKQGKLYSEIAENLNMSLAEVLQIVESKTKRTKKSYKENLKDRIAELYKEGKSIAEISKELKVSESMVQEELLMLGIPGVVPKVQGEGKNKKLKRITDPLEKITATYVEQKLRELLSLQEYEEIKVVIDEYLTNKYLPDDFKEKLVKLKYIVDNMQNKEEAQNEKDYSDEER